MLSPVLVTPPAAQPVTLEELRKYAKADPGEDDLLQIILDSAVQYLDGRAGILGRAMITQTWRQDFEAFDCKLRLPLGPLQAITGIAYRDGANALQTLATSVYTSFSDALGPFVTLAPDQSWPSVYGRLDAVSVTARVGWGDHGLDVPGPLRIAILMLGTHGYENRTPVAVGTISSKIAFAVDALVDPFRKRKL